MASEAPVPDPRAGERYYGDEGGVLEGFLDVIGGEGGEGGAQGMAGEGETYRLIAIQFKNS